MKGDFIRPTEEPTIPPWVRWMLRSKIFWAVAVAFILFVVLWQREGIGWAVGTLAVAGFIALFVFTRRRRVRRYYDYDDDTDEEIIVRKRRRQNSLLSDKTRDLYIPKVGKDFYVSRRK